jgi:transposase
MQVLYTCCAGVDVHKETVVVCVLAAQEGQRQVRKELRTFSTMTRDLGVMRGWLAERQVEQVAMESTGVYWWPVFNILEEVGLGVILVNPQHIKQVPGRKTDMRDAEWLADLCRHGLLDASFIPPAAIRHLRELTRYRTTQVHARTAELNRLQKELESANIKLGAVASEVWGVSGQAMLTALVRGEEDPAVLADLAQGVLRNKLAALALALEGRVKPHHRVLIQCIMRHIRFLEEAIEALDAEIARAAAPFQAAVALLLPIPGVDVVSAVAILAEIGVDMARFPSGQHLASWAGVSPGNHESAGKTRSGKTTRGNPWLRGMLGEVAWAAVRTKGSSFQAMYHRLARRRGAQKAVVAVMHQLLLVIYRLLHDGVVYQEAGADYLPPADPERARRRHIRGLEQLGYDVVLVPKAPKEAA